MAPCKDCTLRYPGCHANCEGYQKFKTEREQINKKRAEINEIHYADQVRTREAVIKIKRRRK